MLVYLCVCVCVCERVRERERERGGRYDIYKDPSRIPQYCCAAPYTSRKIMNSYIG